MVEDDHTSEPSSVAQHVELINKKHLPNGTATTNNTIEIKLEESMEPPDGGTRAWLVMFASFFCNGILFGVINSYGVLYSELHDNLQRRNVSNAAGKAALVGSFAMGTTFFVSPLSGVLTDLMGIRKTTFLGGAIASCGMFLSSFCVDSIVALCITYGMYGLGGSLAYTPSLAVLGHYFKNYLGIVNGIVTAGSSVFTICMPYVMDAFLKHFGIVWTLRLLALIAAMIMLAAFLFKPITMNSNYNNGKIVLNKSVSFKSLFNMTVLKNRKYLIWTFVISISLFGYFVPYVYMLKFVEANFSKDDDNKLPVLCIGITSGLGRLIFGFIADMKNINRILLQQLAFLAIGLFTIILPFTSGHYGWLIVVVLGMGLFDGCFISLLGPLAFDICGRNGATQAIGYLLGLCSIPLTIGPYIAGLILDYNNNDYTIIFILAGIPPTLGSLALYLTRCVNSGVNKQEVGTEYKIQENTIVQDKFNSNNDDEKISLTEPLEC